MSKRAMTPTRAQQEWECVRLHGAHRWIPFDRHGRIKCCQVCMRKEPGPNAGLRALLKPWQREPRAGLGRARA